MQDQSARVPSLDGLRAVSILLVVFGHLVGTAGFPVSSSRVWGPYLASLGVRVFFVISGFLITRLLLIERETHGSIRLTTFYFRRMFRILVPYYAFLALVEVAARLGWVRLDPSDLTYAVAYLTNYHPPAGWPLAHTWSLSVEEQFYLLWPAILVVFGVRRAVWVGAAYLLAAPFGRLYVWFYEPAVRDGIGHTFGTAADAIIAGCLLAALSDTLWRYARYRAMLSSRWFLLVPAALLAIGVVEDHPRLAFTIGAMVVNVGVALGVDRCMRMPWRLSTRLLSRPTLVAIGRGSYSLYLWQQVFIDRTSPAWANSFPWNALFAGLAAFGSYHLIEKPSLSARLALQGWLHRRLPRHVHVPVAPAAAQLSRASMRAA
jgi:peptidoglycan/LPS O-acetylase OafA/YrhL